MQAFFLVFTRKIRLWKTLLKLCEKSVDNIVFIVYNRGIINITRKDQ